MQCTVEPSARNNKVFLRDYEKLTMHWWRPAQSPKWSRCPHRRPAVLREKHQAQIDVLTLLPQCYVHFLLWRDTTKWASEHSGFAGLDFTTLHNTTRVSIFFSQSEHFDYDPIHSDLCMLLCLLMTVSLFWSYLVCACTLYSPDSPSVSSAPVLYTRGRS